MPRSIKYPSYPEELNFHKNLLKNNIHDLKFHINNKWKEQQPHTEEESEKICKLIAEDIINELDFFIKVEFLHKDFANLFLSYETILSKHFSSRIVFSDYERYCMNEDINLILYNQHPTTFLKFNMFVNLLKTFKNQQINPDLSSKQQLKLISADLERFTEPDWRINSENKLVFSTESLQQIDRHELDHNIQMTKQDPRLNKECIWLLEKFLLTLLNLKFRNLTPSLKDSIDPGDIFLREALEEKPTTGEQAIIPDNANKAYFSQPLFSFFNKLTSIFSQPTQQPSRGYELK